MYVVYPSIVNYTYLFQRPQQLMRCFGRQGFDAIFVNNGATLDGCTQYKRPTKVDKNLTVVPQDYDLKKYRNNCIYYNTFPGYTDKIPELNPNLVLFDCIDEPTGIFSHWNINGSWEHAIESADIVLASAKKLYNRSKQFNDETILVPNGCDFDHFKYQKKWDKVPEDIKDLPGKKIMFSGAIAPWLDTDLVYRMAETYPNDSIIMVGALYDMCYADAPKNIHVLGHKDYRILPAYLHNSDVLIIPFDTKNPVIEATNPIKVWEYLATGKPIVTTDIPECGGLGVYRTQSNSQFIQYIEKSMNRFTSKQKDQSIALAKANSWDERMSRIVNKIKEFEGF